MKKIDYAKIQADAQAQAERKKAARLAGGPREPGDHGLEVSVDITDLARVAIEGEVEERFAIESEADAPANDAPKPPAWPVLADLARALGAVGPRLPIGIRAIDDAWRGGAPGGLVMVAQGAPGAGKTTWAAQRSHEWAKAGVPVVYLAGDEPRDGVIIRLGQQAGWRRGWLEDGLPEVREELAAYLAPLPLVILDPDEDPGADILAAAAELRRRFPEGPAVLVADSLQALAQAYPGNLSVRERVDAVVKACKLVARKYKILVLALSEVGRGSYRKQDERIDDLAAGKESSGIEYGAGAVMMLRSVPHEHGLVEVSFPKARPGKIEPFTMRQNFETATFTVEAQAPRDEENEDPEDAAKRAYAVLCGRVLQIVTEKHGLAAPGIVERLPKDGRRKSAVLAALAELERQGRIVNQGPKNAPSWFPATHDA